MRKILNKVVPVSAAAVLAVGFAGGAQAATFKVGGQIDRAFTYANNGKQSGFASVDNDGTDSRFNFSGSQELGDNLKLGFLYEIAVRQAPSSKWDIGNNHDVAPSNASGGVQIDPRHIEAYLQSDAGTFTLGKGFGPAEYTDTVDLSGTTFLGGGIEYTDYAGALSFTDSAGNAKLTVGNVMSNFNALGRTNRVRYDTPKINGFQGSASLDSGKAYELGLTYDLKLPDQARFAAGAGWADSEDHNNDQNPGTGVFSSASSRFRVFNGSASLLLSDGLVFTVGGAWEKTVDFSGSGTASQLGYDASDLFGQLGYRIGKNRIAVNYGETRDLPLQGIVGRQIGLAYLYHWSGAVRFYASYHRYTASLPGFAQTKYGVGSLKPINQIFSGVLIKFM
jgi:predicted porin